MTPSLQADEKTCPFCAETIKRAAILCRFCNRDLATESADPPVEASPEERAKALGVEFKDHHWVYRHRYFRELDAALKHAEMVRSGGDPSQAAGVSDEERATALGITRTEDRWVFQGSYFKDLNAAIRYAGNPDKAAVVAVAAASNATNGGMTAVRVIGLSLLTLISFLIGSGTNTVAAVFTPVFFVSAVCLYFLPAYEAHRREHPSMAAVVILNVFLGWTVLGWVGSLAWATSGSARSRA